MSSFADILSSHMELEQRRVDSFSWLERIKNKIQQEDKFNNQDLTIFVAGSLGRLDFGAKSDVDYFIISKNKMSWLSQVSVFGKLVEINEGFDLPEFSNDGKFLKIHLLSDMIEFTGSPSDDQENLFTTRILLLLESKSLLNEMTYKDCLSQIIKNYYKDASDHPDFFPVYMLNDILRYWRTLCLNYEVIRFDKGRPWRKKNVNLKYSRMLSIFATVVPLLTIPCKDENSILELLTRHPMERLAVGLDNLGNDAYLDDFSEFLSIYEAFLKAKESDDRTIGDETMRQLDERAEAFSGFFYKVLSDEKIPARWRRFLVI